MRQSDLLIKKIEENNGIVTTKSMIKNGIHKDTIKTLAEKGEIIKIASGLYGFPNEDIDEYIYFMHRVPKGIFSHGTAAYLHGLCTRMPIIYVMTVKTGSNVSRIKTEKNNIVFKYSKKEIFDLGKIKIINPYGREISVYDRERTVLDVIKDKNRIDSQVFSETLKTYFSSKNKNLIKLSRYAAEMNMEKELKIYTEVLL